MNEHLFDPDGVAAGRSDGIQRSYDAASDEWKQLAYEQVAFLSRALDDFTTDEVIQRLSVLGVEPPNLMALGGVMQRAAKAGIIRKTGALRRTKIARRHRDLTVWAAT